MAENKKTTTLPRLKGKSHRISIHQYQDAEIVYDRKRNVRSLQLKGISACQYKAHSIKLAVNQNIETFNSKKT